MEISTEFLVLVPIVVGLVEAVKQLGLQSKYAPLLSILLGILGVGLISTFSGVNILQGIIAGLTASGLFSGVKRTLE